MDDRMEMTASTPFRQQHINLTTSFGTKTTLLIRPRLLKSPSRNDTPKDEER